MELEIRPATSTDASTLLGFIRELAEYEREPDAVKVTEAILAQQLSSSTPPFEAKVARLGGEPVGFSLYFHTYSTWLGKRGIHLEDLYVTPEARGHGVGKALLVDLARLAIARDCGRLEWAVLDWNQSAIDFYEKMGASRLSEWETYRLTGDALREVAASDG